MQPLAERLPAWAIAVLALVAGAGATLAFAPVGWFLAAPLGLAVWFGLLIDAPTRQAAWTGYAFGLGFFGTGVTWIFNSLLVFGQAPLVVASFITVLFVLVMALYPALLAGVAARFLPLTRPAGLLALAGGVVLMELARSWLFSGFPWLLFGHTVLDTPLQGWLPLAGELGAGLMVALLAVAVVSVFLSGQRWLGAGLAVAVVIASVVLGLVRWVEPTGEEIPVAMVQGNIDQARKWAPDGIEYSLDIYQELTREAAGDALVVWPETAIPAFYTEVHRPLEGIASELAEAGGELVVGIFDYEAEGRDVFNSVVHVGSGAGYNKRQLVPFGEYIPLRDRLAWLDRLLQIPMSDLSPGRGDGRMEMAGTTAGVSICYESAYARHIRAALPEAGFLVNVSNDAWFGDSLAPAQHLQIARVRAVETGRPMVRSTNTGISALIDADGGILERSGLFTREVVRGTLEPRTGLTPAAALGEGPAVLAALVLVVLGAAVGRRRTPPPSV
ncbi:apolipoprotein N-acyltransferase [Thioalkalivibrio sp. HL-Eb18]|uniref:apolipoprotein N-acyltransferase n=1 Tax=Thioalkalivibrio sp. HL-Eb18 TaxID=1266913 RepID=UPI000376F79F|nr:apolipoprotein N-acyltransferase [Thioalkalivibrio sp. HL-Eb18]